MPRQLTEDERDFLLGDWDEFIQESLESLWSRYRDEEHEAYFPDAAWDVYKEMFKRGPSFPDWLKQVQQEAEK